MSVLAAIYTKDNCKPAYQLNWSLALFWQEAIGRSDWLTDLQAATEPDGVRILEHRFAQPNVSQFLVSTRPETAPERLAWSVKGRLQNLLGRQRPKAFRRNYGLRSLGSATREAVEAYVRSQVEHHPMADPRVQERLRTVQIENAQIDLSAPRRNAHALYWYNLHVCLVNEGRCREVHMESLERLRATVLRAAAKKGHLLSRGGIVPDHIHLTLGCDPSEAPAEVALSYMNNLAYAYGMKRVFAFGFYVGTFGDYDLGATRL
jgi:REP element-mobilizing transposase RayT